MRIRSIKSVDKKIKNMRARFKEACKDVKKNGLSTAEKDDIFLKLGGCELFGLCRSAFEGCSLSPHTSTREPVLFGSAKTRTAARDAVAPTSEATGDLLAATAADRMTAAGEDCPVGSPGRGGAASTAERVSAAGATGAAGRPQGAVDVNSMNAGDATNIGDNFEDGPGSDEAGCGPTARTPSPKSHLMERSWSL